MLLVILAIVVFAGVSAIGVNAIRKLREKPAEKIRKDIETAETSKGLTVYDVCPGDGFGEIHLIGN